ncbi:MAG TPA: PIN domain nuclease [Thermodesulfobacteriota bacterium]|nr:PIN domain nuclease [Thermodesulfobacteriota bacterium]
MVLVDTSVVIDYLKGRDNEHTGKFDAVIKNNIPWGINSFIYQEVLQGARTEKEYGILRNYLSSQRFYGLKDEKKSFEEAAMLYLKCRKKGLTVSSTMDCIIAQTAIENRLLLLHNDSDYVKIARVAGLRFF